VKPQPLSDLISINRRYARSVNLERDLDLPEVVEGYILTERAVDALRRILRSMFGRQRTTAWTLTGVYGTGKSAFAHFLGCLFGPATSPARAKADAIARHGLTPNSPEYLALREKRPARGFFRAIATAQREPISHSLVRAFAKGADEYWRQGHGPAAVKRLLDWETELDFGQVSFTDGEVLNAIQEIAAAADTDILIILDELGKNLEYAAQHQGMADLYLLQQLAELSRKKGSRLYIFALLHQSFADYSQRLASVEKNEWSKIQGRFEDIPFTESAQQMLRLMGQAIDRSQADKLQFPVHKLTGAWCEALAQEAGLGDLSPTLFDATYPLHPVAALVLPELFIRYAQNDRSLFTFLTSSEPHGLQQFLKTAGFENDQLPTFKLHHLYDYFVESIGVGMGSRPGLQRWLEIQGLVADAKHKGEETVNLLKTIGLLNLVTSTGVLRATRSLVKLGMIDRPDEARLAHWETVVEQVRSQGLVTHRRAVDELRIWEGSDFDVEGAIATYAAKDQLPLAAMLAETHPLKPLVAQRHSYRTGTLRYFERHYLEKAADLDALQCTQSDCDGAVVYWLSEEKPEAVPAQTASGKPLILIVAANLPLLRIRALEYRALKKIQTQESALQGDAVARREVRHRLIQAQQLLDDTLGQSFNFAVHHNPCWVEGELTQVDSVTDFNGLLSEVCDRTYARTPILWNELINRRSLTSQGAKARRELIEAMLEHPDQPRLGLEGYGPEVAMYYSVLEQSGIHRQEQGEWGFYPPTASAGRTKGNRGGSRLQSVWDEIAQFCLGAKESPQSLAQLYQMLDAPPYGMKQGAIPVLLAAVLLYYADEVSVYKDGTFVPVLGPEHFELLVKDPARFSVKHIEVAGVRSQVFRELEAILRGGAVKPMGRQGVRNATVLSVVKPLIQFVRKLPNYTLKTRRISEASRRVLQTLLHTQEPDELLFKVLPQACGLEPVVVSEEDDGTVARTYRERLVEALREIHTAYDTLLAECESLLYEAFGLQSRDKLRQNLQFRASHVLGSCLEASLNRFARAAADDSASERQWLEAVVMVVADKPAESWTDEDVTRFELNLSDLSRRFKNLEALQASVKATSKGGFEARRVTVTRPDGSEVNQMVWIDHEQQGKVDPLIDQLLAQCPDAQTRQALLTRLTERMFDEPEPDSEVAKPANRRAHRG
jgi:hypothetical protein